MKQIAHSVLSRCSHWKDFKDALSELTKKQKGDTFELLTKIFLTLHPQYATKIKHVWLLNEVPLDIRTFLRLPDPDEGIDLVVQSSDGEFSAIQCKYME